VLPAAEELAAAGELEQANAKILEVFPAATRTPAETLMLGNVLFRQDPKASYELHKRAAAELPDERMAQLEWGMQQHRAKEYAGAAASYAQVVKDNRDFAPVYGLMAECLLRLGKTGEAVEAFKQSELSQGDSIEQFESWVCDVNSTTFPHRKRQQWFAKA